MNGGKPNTDIGIFAAFNALLLRDLRVYFRSVAHG